MTSHLIDSDIFKDLFGTAAMREIFSDASLIERWLIVEAALARAEAKTGLIPAAAAEEISRQATVASIDIERLKSDTELVGYPIVSIVRQLSAACTNEAGAYVHWGATTQDIMDTAVVLQIRDALIVLERGIRALRDTLVGLAVRHRGTLMAGRTHGQQALPITFGFKAAVWLAEVHRHIQRLEEIRTRALVGQLGGAVGTLASLGELGLEVQSAFMAELGLGQPAIAWHVSRDVFAEITAFLGMISATLGKIGTEIALLMKTETAEVSEPFVEGRGSSSTMPQKRNPISCEVIVAVAKIVRQHVPLALDAMVQDHERSTGPWQVEWEFLPEAFILTDGALQQCCTMLAGLEVHPDRMRQNLDQTDGLISAEAVMMALARSTGRQQAHEVVYRACRRATMTGSPLVTVMQDMPEITQHVRATEIQDLLDPARYLGSARAFVDRVVAQVRGDTKDDGVAAP